VISILNPFLLCKTKSQKKTIQKHKNASKKLAEEMDCVSIVKSIRELKILTKLILDQNQRQLLDFSRESIIPDYKPPEKDKRQLENWMPYRNSENYRFFAYESKVNTFMKKWKWRDDSEINLQLVNEVLATKKDVQTRDCKVTEYQSTPTLKTINQTWRDQVREKPSQDFEAKIRIRK